MQGEGGGRGGRASGRGVANVDPLGTSWSLPPQAAKRERVRGEGREEATRGGGGEGMGGLARHANRGERQR